MEKQTKNIHMGKLKSSIFGDSTQQTKHIFLFGKKQNHCASLDDHATTKPNKSKNIQQLHAQTLFFAEFGGWYVQNKL